MSMLFRLFAFVALATEAHAALKLPSFTRKPLEPPPPAGFAWAGTSGKVVPTTAGVVVPTKFTPAPVTTIAAPAEESEPTMPNEPRVTTYELVAAGSKVLTASAKAALKVVLLPTLMLGSLLTTQPAPPKGFKWGYSEVSTVSPKAVARVLLGKPVTVAKRVAAAASVYAAVVLAALKVVLARFQTYGPDAIGTFVDIGKGVAAAASVYSAVVLAYVKIVIGRFQTYGPEMLATFNDLGKGVAAASWDYTVIASAATYDAAQVALAYMKIVAARFEKYGPDALGTFSDIGKGVAAASAVYWAVAMGTRRLWRLGLKYARCHRHLQGYR